MIIVVLLVFVVCAGSTGYFAWPRIWEHLNASAIYDMEVEARDHLLKGDSSKIKGEFAQAQREYSQSQQLYGKLFGMVENHSRYSAELQKVLTRAKVGQQQAAEGLSSATTQPGAVFDANAVMLSIDGSVYLTTTDKGPEYLSGVEVNFLHPIAPRSTLMVFLNTMRQMAVSEEAQQIKRANQLREKAQSQTNPEALQWQNMIRQDIERGNAFHEFQGEVDQFVKQSPANEDLEALRQDILSLNLQYRVAAGSASPKTDIFHDVVGSDFDEVVRVMRAKSAITDDHGHYAIKDLPAGVYYIFVTWKDGKRHAEWLVQEKLFVGPEIHNLDLNNKNVKAVSN